ncbi:MAG: PfkB family carbohydrate kinase, partial [Gammaproteobacteria bacterium]|nr:PfkB family carbohydrate kinase [Gammaproteobacteria bacterium]
IGDQAAADLLVTAIYLAREGLDVSFVGIVEDEIDKNRLAWEGVNTDLLLQKTAKDFFSEEGLATVSSELSQCNYIFVTGQVLSLLSDEERERLINTLKSLRGSGTKIVFDCNHSAARWDDERSATKAYTALIAITDISLPNYEEESALFMDESTAALIARHHALGVPEIALKNGIRPNWLSTKPEKSPKEFPVERIEQVVDDSGVGEAFNAAYVATRISGRTYCGSVEQGQLLAAKVVQFPGAILPK